MVRSTPSRSRRTPRRREIFWKFSMVWERLQPRKPHQTSLRG